MRFARPRARAKLTFARLEILMKRLLILAALAACLPLGACASLGGGEPSGLPQAVLDNLEYCKRTYQASVGGLGIPGGSLYIECAPKPLPTAAQPAS